ncbi:hypothetical protein FOA52_003384 [Chlamydomonas sp. UWO 241]|nr:hypothetical protein FOA52_003384 [Chlamydomonas sp. UWO 241]
MQRPTSGSTTNLEGLASSLAGLAANDREATLIAELEAAAKQVSKLKLSRVTLLEQIDGQWEEMDRLAGEHRAATEEVGEVRRLAAAWEAQAQDALQHVDRLRALLEESAEWEADLAAKAMAAGGKGAAAAQAQAQQSKLLAQVAKAAEAELATRALAAELTRAQHASVSIGRSVLPVLCGIEHRLENMCARAGGSLSHWRQQRLATEQRVGGNGLLGEQGHGQQLAMVPSSAHPHVVMP